MTNEEFNLYNVATKLLLASRELKKGLKKQVEIYQGLIDDDKKKPSEDELVKFAEFVKEGKDLIEMETKKSAIFEKVKRDIEDKYFKTEDGALLSSLHVEGWNIE